MNFTLSSLLTVLIFSNLAILLFHYIINSPFLYYKFAFPILFVLFCVVMIRLFIPLELSTHRLLLRSRNYTIFIFMRPVIITLKIYGFVLPEKSYVLFIGGIHLFICCGKI